MRVCFLYHYFCGYYFYDFYDCLVVCRFFLFVNVYLFVAVKIVFVIVAINSLAMSVEHFFRAYMSYVLVNQLGFPVCLPEQAFAIVK